MTAVPAWIRRKAAGTLNPAQVENTLEQRERELARGCTAAARSDRAVSAGRSIAPALDFRFKHLCRAVGAASGDSSLAAPIRKICSAPRSHGAMLADLQATGEGSTFCGQLSRALRFWKGREMLRIALREVAEAAPLEETTLELSLLAEICLREVYHHWNASCAAGAAGPDAQFAILGLGKLAAVS